MGYVKMGYSTNLTWLRKMPRVVVLVQLGMRYDRGDKKNSSKLLSAIMEPLGQNRPQRIIPVNKNTFINTRILDGDMPRL